MFANSNGVSSFVHPEGVYDDPKGGSLRIALYPRLRRHFQFINEEKLFDGIHHSTIFSLNVYSNALTEKFDTIGNLYSVEAIEECYDPYITGPVPGIKDENGWCSIGHPDRVISIGEEELRLFAKLFDGSKQWKAARLPVIHCKQVVEVLECFSRQKRTLASMKDDVSCPS